MRSPIFIVALGSSSLMRDATCTPALGAQNSLSHLTIREVPGPHFFKGLFILLHPLFPSACHVASSLLTYLKFAYSSAIQIYFQTRQMNFSIIIEKFGPGALGSIGISI